MDGQFPIIGVGASAGGLEALRELVTGYDGDLAMAFIVVQHLDPNHESMMAQLIERYTAMPVRQISGGEKVERGEVYVIPPGHGLSIRNGVLKLEEFEQPRGMRRPIDDFFESLGRDQGRLSAGVILSGTGADGSRGIRAIKEHGGIAIAQDADDARYDGMPLSAAGTGLMDFVIPARDILKTLNEYFSRKETDTDPEKAVVVTDHLDDLCGLLNEITGHDFSGYKRSTLVRRIDRRMQVMGIEDGAEYLRLLRTDDNECQALFRDLLINVTRFFRDAQAFDVLREKAIEPLVLDSQDSDEIRIWVAGCSSGEEAYSIAMLFRDAMERHERYPVVSIFASDIDEQMLSIAREGAYPTAAMADIPERLRDHYTVGTGEHFTILPQIRDMVRFSSHSLIKDPPFSRIDLISCRNLLIYLDDRLQKAVLPIFHYALRSDGFLFLGPSETIGRFEDLFDDVNHRARLFKRRPVRPSYPLELPAAPSRKQSRNTSRSQREDLPGWIETDALNQMLQRHAPASLLLDRNGMILANWGPIGRYFDFPTEQVRRHEAPGLAKPGLRDVLGPLLRQTAADNRPHVARSVQVQADFGSQEVRVICEPVRDKAMLVVIRETGQFVASQDSDMVEFTEGDDQVQLLESELRTVRHRLRSTVEELETANEELKSSNEEMMSMNEELQSTNEELTTVNDELKSKVDQLTVANSDLKNFFDSTQLAVILLSSELDIRSFTDAAGSLFNLDAGDRTRKLRDAVPVLRNEGFVETAREVARTGKAQERRLSLEKAEKQFAVRIMPYRTMDGSIDGVTVILTDITAFLDMERQLAEERERLQLAMDVAGIGTWEYDPATGQTVMDRTEQMFFGLDDAESGDFEAVIAKVHPDERPDVEQGLQVTASGGGDFAEVFRVGTEGESHRWLRGLGRDVKRNGSTRIIGVTYDITAEHDLLQQRELHLKEMNHRIKNLFAVVSAMISSAERESEDLETFGRNLRGRVAALDRAHGLMVHDDLRSPLDLEKILNRVLEPSRGGQDITLDGPEVMIPVKMLTPLVLILHEWTTNSTKYGALSSPDGTLTISWTLDGAQLAMDWRETTDTFHENGSGGFGSRLVQASVMQLGAETDKTFADGVLRQSLALEVVNETENA